MMQGIIAGTAPLVKTNTETFPYSQTFTQVSSKTDFDPLGVELLNEPFTTDTGQLQITSESTPGVVTFTGGNLSVAHTGVQNTIIRTGADVAAPVRWFEINVVSRTSLGSGYNNVGVGMAKDANNFIFASFDQRANLRRVQVKIAGSNVFYASAAYTFPASVKIALSLVMNSASVWIDSGSGWQCLVTHQIPTATVNMKTLDLTGWKAAFTVAASASVTWVFDNLKSGIFGGVGIRDMTLVTNASGEPISFSGKYRFTATSVCPAGTGYNSVWEYNPADYSIAIIGSILVNRGGARQNDLNAHIVQNNDLTYRVITASWGNGFGGVIQCFHKNNVGDIMSGEAYINNPDQLSLPLIPGTGSGGAYDPYLIYNVDRWVLAYAVVDRTDFLGENFYIASAYTFDFVTFTGIASDPSRTKVEGPKICKSNDEFFIYGGGRGIQPAYDLSMNYVGDPGFSPDLYNGSDTQPHVMIFPHGSSYHCLTWNQVRFGTAAFTWGDFLVYTAARLI